MMGGNVFFKAENLQKVGAFKARGAVNSLQKLSEEERKKGVATHSSGNHGQALAWAARELGIPATVVVPSNAPSVKVEAMKGYGADVIFCEPTLEARESTLANVLQKTGGIEIHPYNQVGTIEGQSTCAQEILEQCPEVDVIFCPLGGGGLLSGTLLATRDHKAEVYGVEPEMADDGLQSLRAGKIIPSVNPNTMADGLKTSLGSLTFPIISEHVKDIFTASEDDIVKWTRWMWMRTKMVIEPSAAVGIAAAANHSHLIKGKNTVIILTGGNVDIAKMASHF
ncbi:MAG: pyridoxal-phosphate dependent enzyme [Schleiferiaceae bacterium]